MPPCISKSLPETCQCRKAASEKDRSATSEPVIEGYREPAADESTTEIRSRVRQTQQPCGSRVLAGNAKLLTVEELGAIDDGFIYWRINPRTKEIIAEDIPIPCTAAQVEQSTITK